MTPEIKKLKAECHKLLDDFLGKNKNNQLKRTEAYLHIAYYLKGKPYHFSKMHTKEELLKAKKILVYMISLKNERDCGSKYADKDVVKMELQKIKKERETFSYKIKLWYTRLVRDLYILLLRTF